MVTDIDNKYYIRRQKDKLKKAMESGMLKPEQQWAVIDDTIDKLLVVKDGIDVEAVKEFEKQINDHIDEINNIQIKINNLYKKAYDKLLEL